MSDLSSTGKPSDATPISTVSVEKAETRPNPDAANDPLRFDAPVGGNMFLGSIGEHSLAPAHGIQVAAILSLLLWILATVLLWWLW